MASRSAVLGRQLSVGVVLFDATHSRVFAIRGLIIEDARELMVSAEGTGIKRSRSGKPTFAPEWLRHRACYTAQLAAGLHETWHFDALLIAGPRTAVALLHESWPAGLAACPITALRLAVTAGESAIIGATLAAMPRVARRWERVLRARAVQAATAPPVHTGKPFSPAVPLAALRLPNSALAAAAASAGAPQLHLAAV